ncbi:DUF1707 domain-containing protein [Rhodococcus sp. 14C212]|nr:DUF1707 domain-containing protein [Rhodococcus sp. 14C212]
MADSPEVRIGTAEREQAQRLLGEHFGAGRLTLTEFEDRSGRIAAAVTRRDLALLFTDLPPVTGRTDGHRHGWWLLVPVVVLGLFAFYELLEPNVWVMTGATAVATVAVLAVRARGGRPRTAEPAFLRDVPPLPAPVSRDPQPPATRDVPDVVWLLTMSMFAVAPALVLRHPIALLISAVALILIISRAFRTGTGGTGR